MTEVRRKSRSSFQRASTRVGLIIVGWRVPVVKPLVLSSGSRRAASFAGAQRYGRARRLSTPWWGFFWSFPPELPRFGRNLKWSHEMGGGDSFDRMTDTSERGTRIDRDSLSPDRRQHSPSRRRKGGGRAPRRPRPPRLQLSAHGGRLVESLHRPPPVGLQRDRGDAVFASPEGSRKLVHLALRVWFPEACRSIPHVGEL